MQFIVKGFIVWNRDKKMLSVKFRLIYLELKQDIGMAGISYNLHP